VRQWLIKIDNVVKPSRGERIPAGVHPTLTMTVNSRNRSY
jgi:hypothetical protein